MFKFSTRIIFFVIFFTFLKSYIIGQNCSVNAGIDQTICIGESAFLSVSDGITTLPQGSSYTWSNGEQNYKIVVSPSVTTTYTVTITSGSCSATDQVTVQVSAKPTISLVNLTSANCGTSNGSISVSATGVGSPSYAWSSGQNSSTISGVSAGTYKVTVTDDNGCTNSAIYVVGVNGSSGISGVVYGDFNYNSINDQFFQGYRNVPVKLYGSNAAGNSELVAQTTTNATGSYSFPNVSFANGERYRLEFTPPLNYFVTKEANKDNLQVRYISGPVCNADLAISVPSDYCHTDNPMYTVPQQINGNGLLGGSTAVQTAIWTANYQNKGFPGSADYTPSASAATQSTVGSLYGVGYQRYSKQAFYSAYLKRHTGLGLGGLDAIYKIDFSSGSAGSPNLYLKLSNLGVNVGSIGARDIPANFGEPSYDVEAFGKIGKVGIGDIDVSDDGATLYAVNLFQKTLIGINIGNPVSNNPTLQLNIPIPNPGCGDDWRPFGLKYYGGKLFVSGVCSGESTGGVPTGYVFEYTPNVGFNFNPILTFPIDWTRPTVGCDGAQWGPWDSEYPTNASQPIFSDMEFEVDGSMVIGLRNREGDMYGFQNYEPILGSTNLISRFNPGDILRADPNGDGTFTLENNGVSQGKVGCGSGNGEGPGGGEFFCGDNFLCHNEVATGALGKFTGSGEAISTAIDPFRAWSQGIMRFSVIDGSTLNGYEFIQTDVNNPQGFGKANGLGDIEFFCDPAPLEIGDYLWVDDNKNGIQDPKELPLAGQTIKLFDINGTEKASTTTDVAGYYYFLNVNPSTQYYITVENYNNGLESGGQTYVLTKPNQGADDRIDSDGEVKGFGVPTAILNKPSILLTTGLPGETNHSYDFGFSTCSINVSAGQDVVLCAGTCVTLTTGVSGAFGAVTYSWSTGASTSSVLVCPDQNRTYIVTVTDQLGCKATDNIMISIEQLPISGINGPTNICTNTPANFAAINAGNGATYLWTFDGGSTQDGDFNDISEIVTWTNAQAATNRNITLYVESSNGCFSNYTKQIAIGNSVAASAGNDRSVCGSGGCFEIGGTLSQVAPLGGTVAWSPTTYLSSSVIPNPQVCLPSNVSNITYTVTVTKNGCTATDQVVVTKDNTLNPVANAGNDISVCVGQSVQLGGNPTGSVPSPDQISGYLWNPSLGLNSATSSNPTVTISTSRTYTVTVTSASGCTATDDVTVTVTDNAKIGDFVWLDTNGNGCQDPGELGINGVTVKLFTSAGVEVASATTVNNPVGGAAGYYQFTICPGSYYVNFGQPIGFVFTGDKTCGNANTDSDANISTGNTQTFTLISGQVLSNIDAGYKPLGNIRGNVTADTNNDNIGDTPLSNVTLQLKDPVTGAVIATTTTNAQGNYEFLNVLAGNYTIMQIQPNGYQSVSDEDATPDPDGNDGATPNDMIPVTVTPGENDNDNNFVEEQLGNIRGNVSKDTDNNNTGDSPFAGVTIQLKDAITNAVLATTLTDASGNYAFLNQAPGNYIVMEVQPTGYVSVSDVDATPDPDGNDGATPNDMIPVTLTAGENDNDNNFVEEQLGNIRGNVSKDTDNNNTGDSPFAGVTIQLKDAITNAVLATTLTDASGNYAFLNQVPGNYIVMEVQPTGYVSVSDVDATPDPDGNDGATPNDMIPVTLTAGENDNDNNFVEEQLGNIRGNVSKDTDNNNTGDSPFAGVTIQLKDAITNAVLATTVTDASGNYAFLNQVPGNYIVMEIQPAGYQSVSDVDATPDPDGNDGATPNDMIPVTLTAGENDNDNNFVELNFASLGDFVWHDLNANGKQEIGEPGIGGVTVRLFKDGVQVSSTITGLNGFYSFVNLLPGAYTVKFDAPNDYFTTLQDIGTNDGIDSDANTINGLTETIVLRGGDNNTTIDAGFYKLARIGDFVWEDRNANGIQDAFEPGIANVLVTLTGTDVFGAPVNKSTTTSNTGLYEFTNLVPGTYILTFTKPGDTYKSSPSKSGTDDAKDSDASMTTGQTTPVVLKSGDNNQMIDAGFYRCAYVGDYVWIDNNENNLQDVGEAGLNGVLVELYKTSNPNSPVQTMLTINDPRGGREGMKGYYMFEICDLGNYFIKVKPDMNIYQYVQADQGFDDTIDSDIIDFINQSTTTFTVNYAAEITDIDAGVKFKPLPVTLTTFTGRYNTIREVNELEWTTVSEVNNDYFEIERSIDNGSFEVIGKVAGRGQSNVETTYNFDDNDIRLNGVYTYRLRQVDYDGKMTQSGYVVIRKVGKETQKVNIYPNPSTSDVHIDLGMREGTRVRADIYDRTGRVVVQGLIDRVVEGSEYIKATINGGTLSPGVYVVFINIDGEIQTQKLIIIE